MHKGIVSEFVSSGIISFVSFNIFSPVFSAEVPLFNIYTFSGVYV